MEFDGQQTGAREAGLERRPGMRRRRHGQCDDGLRRHEAGCGRVRFANGRRQALGIETRNRVYLAARQREGQHAHRGRGRHGGGHRGHQQRLDRGGGGAGNRLAGRRRGFKNSRGRGRFHAAAWRALDRYRHGSLGGNQQPFHGFRLGSGSGGLAAANGSWATCGMAGSAMAASWEIGGAFGSAGPDGARRRFGVRQRTATA